MAPAIFNGDWRYSDQFLRQFQLYRNANHKNDAIKEPFRCTNIALSLIRGPNVEDWVKMQLNYLEHQASMVEYISEDIWDDFEADFRAAFTDTTKQAQAYNKLMSFEQGSLSIDDYIAQFEALCKRAKWPRNTP